YHNFNGYGVCEAYEHLLYGTNVSNLKFGSHNDNYFCTAIIDDHVLYFGLSNFKITPLMSDASVPEPQRDDYDNDELFEEDHSNWLAMQNAKDVVDTYLHNALDNPAITDVVFDLRGNIGGYLMDNFYLLGLFLEQPTVAIYTHHKSGIGRYDYSPWIPQVFYPYERTRKLSGKIVVLCDLYSISMAEISGLLAKIMPNAYLMGERTYGAQGMLEGDFNLFYSGSFGSVDGPHYGYMCDLCTRTVDGALLEGKGVTPDITLDYNYDECYGDNRDAWLDRAIEFIATGR
ncbi:MAG: S41 family peptidase, partial [Muribaculaceae bacterium]